MRGVKPAKKPAAKSKDIHEICPKTGEISNLVTHTFGAGERAELSAKLEAALESRSVGATNCNVSWMDLTQLFLPKIPALLCGGTQEVSSRSHTVLQLKVKRTTEHGQEVEGELNLVDLAGSERISLSGVTGDRQKETQNINASLSALGDVIASMNSTRSHVPYRKPRCSEV